MRLISDFALAVCTIWSEARGEPDMGKLAVAEVLRTRMKRGPRTVAEVVLAPYQFSCWNTKDPNRIPAAELEDADPVVKGCIKAWLASETSDFTRGATHYVNLDVAHPAWADEMELVVTVGRHTFFKTRSA